MVFDQKGVVSIGGVLVLVLSSIVIGRTPDIIEIFHAYKRAESCKNEIFKCVHF